MTSRPPTSFVLPRAAVAPVRSSRERARFPFGCSPPRTPREAAPAHHHHLLALLIERVAGARACACACVVCCVCEDPFAWVLSLWRRPWGTTRYAALGDLGRFVGAPWRARLCQGAASPVVEVGGSRGRPRGAYCLTSLKPLVTRTRNVCPSRASIMSASLKPLILLTSSNKRHDPLEPSDANLRMRSRCGARALRLAARDARLEAPLVAAAARARHRRRRRRAVASATRARRGERRGERRRRQQHWRGGRRAAAAWRRLGVRAVRGTRHCIALQPITFEAAATWAFSRFEVRCTAGAARFGRGAVPRGRRQAAPGLSSGSIARWRASASREIARKTGVRQDINRRDGGQQAYDDAGRATP